MIRQKINKEEFIAIKSEITDDGISISFRGKKYKIAYPKEIWKDYSEANKEFLLDNITFMQTSYLPPSMKKRGAIYSTSLPLLESFAFKSTLYDIPSTAKIDGNKTTDYMKSFFNSEFIFASYDAVIPEIGKRKRANSKKKPVAIIPFTAGKESLLTLGLCLELGIKPIPVYIDEDPEHPESKHKEKIIRTIESEYGIKVYKLLNEPGKKLRFVDNPDNNWGLGAQLISYLLELFPFINYFEADYVFFGNEYSCDEYTYDKEGFKSSFWFDQRSEWTMQLNSIAKMLTNNTTEVGSLVNPLYEIALLKILHERYPYLAQLQMSCFSDTEEGKHRIWCGTCPKCGWMYAFFKGLGIDTAKLGFKNELFTKDNKHLFTIFGGDGIYTQDAIGIGEEEQALAFYMAAEKGEKGELIEEFKKMPQYEDMKANFKKLQKKYFSQYESITIPYALKEGVMDIYDETFEGSFTIKDFRSRPSDGAEKIETKEEILK